MSFLLVTILLLVIILLPQWWVKMVFLKYSQDREDFPGTAGEFAEYIIAQFDCQGVSVMSADGVSHFNPKEKFVVLSPQYYDGKSLTAIAIAAHEIGHLIQAEQGVSLFKLRSELLLWAGRLDKFGVMAFFLIPLVALLAKSPTISVILLLSAFSGMLMNVLAHLVTLPLELDASFGKALPILTTSEYIREEDEPRIRKILAAAALTYLASALFGLLNLARWIKVLRR